MIFLLLFLSSIIFIVSIDLLQGFPLSKTVSFSQYFLALGPTDYVFFFLFFLPLLFQLTKHFLQQYQQKRASK